MLPPVFRPPYTDAWLEWIDANRLAPAAARTLADAPLPEPIRAHLHQSYMQARAQWLLRKTALRRFLALMASDPTQPVILLKGAALALTLYEDPALRPMNDIDLLLRPENLAAAVQRLRSAGYEERSLGSGDDVGYLHHFIFDDPHTRVRLELHRTLPLLPDADDGLQWFLGQARAHTQDDLSFLTLTPAANLLHQAAHAVLEHGGEQGAIAIWYYDIDLLLRRQGEAIDWRQTIARARTLEWEAALHQAILLARRYFATPTPAAIDDWLQLPATGMSGYNTLRSLTAANRSSSRLILHMLRDLTWRQRLTQIAHLAFPARAYMQRRYPRLPWPLAYPYRWFDAARKLLGRPSGGDNRVPADED